MAHSDRSSADLSAPAERRGEVGQSFEVELGIVNEARLVMDKINDPLKEILVECMSLNACSKSLSMYSSCEDSSRRRAQNLALFPQGPPQHLGCPRFDIKFVGPVFNHCIKNLHVDWWHTRESRVFD